MRIKYAAQAILFGLALEHLHAQGHLSGIDEAHGDASSRAPQSATPFIEDAGPIDPSQRRRLRPTPDTKLHPGIIELQVASRDGSPDVNWAGKPVANRTISLIRCRNYASAYSAAWLAPVDLVLRTKFANRLTLEWHSHNLYQAIQGGVYKIEDHFAFFVNHMSDYEHRLAGRRKELAPRMVESLQRVIEAEDERVCGHRQARGKAHGAIVGAVPFYPGVVGNGSDTGNAHSVSSAEVKAQWLKVVCCSLAEFMGAVLIGTCSKEHQELALRVLSPLDLPQSQVEVRLFDCEKPVYLPYLVLREVQAQVQGARKLSSGEMESGSGKSAARNRHHRHDGPAWDQALGHGGGSGVGGAVLGPEVWGAVRYVYFSEMDNCLHVESEAVLDAVVDFLGPRGYASPNRMNFKGGAPARDLVGPNAFHINGQNSCGRTR